MRKLTNVVVSAALVWSGATAASAEGEKARFLNWSDFVAVSVLERFEQETGFALEIDSYAHSNEAESRLIARGTGYDLAVVSSESVDRVLHSGALQKLDRSRLPDVVRQDSFLMATLFGHQPELLDYAVPYIWGTTGLAYHAEEVAKRVPDAPTDSWALLFDPQYARQLADCGITIVDSNEEVVGAALAYLGRDPRSKTQEDLDAAFALLAAIEPYVSDFNTEQFDDLMNGEICLTMTWSSEGLGSYLEGDGTYEYVIPKEGTNIWADVFVIPQDAKRPDLAAATINHLMAPDNLKAGLEYLFGPVSSPEVAAILDNPQFDHPALALPEDVRRTLYFTAQYSGVEKAELDVRWRNLQLGLTN